MFFDTETSDNGLACAKAKDGTVLTGIWTTYIEGNCVPSHLEASEKGAVPHGFIDERTSGGFAMSEWHFTTKNGSGRENGRIMVV